MEFLIAMLVLVAVLAAWGVSIYNSLVSKRNVVDNAWAQIDVQLRRRFDLIPNLVETVKGYAAHEKDTLERVIQARAAGMGAGTPAEAGKADGMLTEALKSIFALAESYPDLKANEGFLNLQRQLSDTEDKVAFARQFYNDSTTDFNTAIQVVPASMVAGAFGFKGRELFTAPASAAEPTAVKF